MNTPRKRRFLILLAPFILIAAALTIAAVQRQSAPPDEPIIAAFKKTYPASASDAVELVTGKNGTMGHDMKPYTGGAMVGRAVTSLVKPAPPEQATPALSTKHSVEMIDNAKPGEVGVIVMEGTLDIAAMGNLMATAAKVTVAEVEHLVPAGELNPDHIHTPGIFVKRIVEVGTAKKHIEFRNTRPRPSRATPAATGVEI